MKSTFKSRFWKIAKWFAGLFILLFVFRLMYGYISTDTSASSDYSDDFFGSIENLRKNYASEKISMKNDVQVASNIASNQKYEKLLQLKQRLLNLRKMKS